MWTPKIMLKVYSRALREELHPAPRPSAAQCPRSLRPAGGARPLPVSAEGARLESPEEGSARNYVIRKIGLLVQQVGMARPTPTLTLSFCFC